MNNPRGWASGSYWLYLIDYIKVNQIPKKKHTKDFRKKYRLYKYSGRFKTISYEIIFCWETMFSPGS